MRRVYPNKDVCIGCHICEVACLTAHSASQDVVIAANEEAVTGLQPCKAVYDKGQISVALSCRHCDSPSCVSACISGALYKDQETGRTCYNEEQCVGCWSCLMACPYGAVRRNVTKGKIIKCDLCEGRDMPACVEACPNGALVFESR